MATRPVWRPSFRRIPWWPSATIDYPRQLFAEPNDPWYPDQSAYLNTIRMSAAWDRVIDASSQIIAIVDTGVDTGHPDLVGRLVPGYNAVNPGTPTDR